MEELSPIMKLIRSGYIQQKMHEGYSHDEAVEKFDKVRHGKFRPRQMREPYENTP